MREYDLLRIQLLKALIELEEKLLNTEKESIQPFVNAKNSNEKVPVQQNNSEMKAVLSVSELSNYLGVSTDCIYTMVRENQIPFVSVRRRILFDRDSIYSWIHTAPSEKINFGNKKTTDYPY